MEKFAHFLIKLNFDGSFALKLNTRDKNECFLLFYFKKNSAKMLLNSCTVVFFNIEKSFKNLEIAHQQTVI